MLMFWSRMCLTVGAWKTEHFCCCCYYFYGSPQLPSSSTFALFSRYVSSHFYDSDDEDPGKKTAAEICWFVKIGLFFLLFLLQTWKPKIYRCSRDQDEENMTAAVYQKAPSTISSKLSPFFDWPKAEAN